MDNLDPDKLSSRKEGAVLVKLWRIIIRDNNYTYAIPRMVTRYINKNTKHNAMSSVKMKTKSSLKKDILSSEMTWKTFVSLIFDFLRVKDMVISIKLIHASGDESVHSMRIINPNKEIIEEEEIKTEENKNG